MSVATINTKATGYVAPQEDVDLTFEGIVEAGFTPPPNPTVDLSASVQVPELPAPPVADYAKDTVGIATGQWVYELTQTPLAKYDLVADLNAAVEALAYKITYKEFGTRLPPDQYPAPGQHLEPVQPEAKTMLVAALRANGDRQIQGRYGYMSGPVCAVGLAMETLVGGMGSGALARLHRYGFTSRILNHIANLNDTGSTFNQIADWVVTNL